MFLGSGLTDPDVALAAAVQLYAAYGLKYPAALNGPQFLQGTFPEAAARGEGRRGRPCPRGPGSGVEVDEARCAQAAAPRRAQIAVPGFVFRDVTSTSVELVENGAPVFVYNHGMMLKPGAPRAYARSCYLHPVYAPNGAVVTDDFPRDHYHHRGISWMWPVVRVGGQPVRPVGVQGHPDALRALDRARGRRAIRRGWRWRTAGSWATARW